MSISMNRIADTFPSGQTKLRCSAVEGEKAWFYETPFTTTAWEEYYGFEPVASWVGKGMHLPLAVGEAYDVEAVYTACQDVYVYGY